MKVGVIGGSGLYQLGEEGRSETVTTPFGEPSSPLNFRTIGSTEVVFVARHNQGHRILPSEINYRANIFALKQAGCTHVVSMSAVGSLREEIEPGDFVLPDQYIDRTRGVRERTFFGEGIVGHAHFADPTCKELRAHCTEHLKKVGIRVHTGGTYVCIEGPQFSSRAESHLYRSWNSETLPISVIGMTAVPEAQLAREAGLCYQTVATATDYDCWNESKGDVNVEAILRILKANVANAQKFLVSLLSDGLPPCRIAEADKMRNGVVTPRELWPKSKKEVMETLLD